MNIDLAKFPPLPQHRAEGLAVFLEPIAGSGERLCVAVAARGPNRSYEVVTVIKRETAKCMLGTAGPKLTSLIELAVQSLRRHLSTGGELDNWHPPLSGVSVGDIQYGQVSDLTMMLRTTARNSAFLSSLADFCLDQEDEVDDTSGSERWLTQVREATIAEVPRLAECFGRRMSLVSGPARTQCDFVGARFAAQLGRLIPGPSISPMIKAAKAKLWDLESLRDMDSGNLFHFDAFELILYRPSDNDPAYSDKEIARLHDALDELTETGDKQSLIVRPVYSAQEAAQRIVKAEVA